MVFPAVVGLESPSRDEANWPSSRFSRSGETRRSYGWLRMVSTRCASSDFQLGAPRDVGGMREAAGTVAGSLVGSSNTRKRTAVQLSGESTQDWARAEGRLIVHEPWGSTEPLCARIKGANRDGKIPATFFQGCTWRWTAAGCWYCKGMTLPTVGLTGLTRGTI